MALLAIIGLWLWVTAVTAAPQINFPINAQLPPVARVSKHFEYVFSDATFVSSEPEITYSLAGAPLWLQLDSNSRSLHGLPSVTDVGTPTFVLIGTDATGSTNMQVTLEVSSGPGPALGEPLLPQLQRIGPTSSSNTLLMYPGQRFSFSFDPDTFADAPKSTAFYATSGENSPLPSWIGFDPSTLGFAGSSPSMVSANSVPETFIFNVIASDTPGFSSVSVTFQIVVGYHILIFDQSYQILNFSRGQPFSTPHFRDSLTLDGKSLGKDSIAHVEAELPDWLELNEGKISLTGIAPSNAGSENVTISVSDKYGDNAKMTIGLRVSQLFTGGVESITATPGKDISYAFEPSLLSDDAVHLDVDLGKASSWLKYDPGEWRLKGQVPSDLQPQTFSIRLIASRGSTNETRNFDITVPDKDHPNDSDSVSTKSASPHKKAWVIAVAVVVPMLTLMLIALLIVCWRRKAQLFPKRESQMREKQLISRPILPDDASHSTGADTLTDQRPPEPEAHILRAPSPPPKLELNPLWEISSIRRPKSSKSGVTGDDENRVGAVALGWDLMRPGTGNGSKEFKVLEDNPIKEESNDRVDSLSHKRQSQSTLNYSRKRQPLKQSQQKVLPSSTSEKRTSRRISGITPVASGLPVRLSGAGHGNGGFGPPGHGVVRVSWQNTQNSLQSDGSSIDNIAPLFPRPPPVARLADGSSKVDHRKRVSLRTVTYPSEPALSEYDDPLEAFVQERARMRGSNNPLFSGRISSRTGSNTRGRERERTLRIPSMVETARSASVYTDDLGSVNWTRPFSQASSTFEPPARARNRNSQAGLGKRHRDQSARLPRFKSQGSLNSSRRFESAESLSGFDDYQDLVNDYQNALGQRYWYQLPPHTRASSLQELDSGAVLDGDEPACPAASSRESRLHRLSRLESSLTASQSDRKFRLGDTPERRPISIDDTSRLGVGVKGSFRGDLAFV